MTENYELKIIFVEDVDADFELAGRELMRNGISFIPIRVENSHDFRKALNESRFDIVISDYSLPQFNGMEALKIAKEYDFALPFIILTGTLNEEIAVECMKAGANDYVIKEHIGKLSFAVKEALKYRSAMLEKGEAEAALLESELRYRSMFENNYAVMLMVDSEDASIVDANPAALDYYGFTHEDIISKNLSEINFPDKTTLIEKLNLSIRGNKNYFITKHKLKNSIERDVEVFLSPISFSDRKLVHCIIQDITERNLALRELHKSLNEKKELIKEIHHRTKNNMQVIISMFSLQAIFTKDERLGSVLMDMENRIRAMSLVHDKLYKSNDLSKLNLKDYLIDLVNNIITGYGNTYNRIQVNERMDDIEVLIDTAIPCGLVVNELVSNVVKHAFPGDNHGILTIKLSADATDEIELTIADNGSGRGMSLDSENGQSMGFQIVKNIVQYQLKGNFIFNNDEGTSWVIKFKDNVYEARV